MEMQSDNFSIISSIFPVFVPSEKCLQAREDVFFCHGCVFKPAQLLLSPVFRLLFSTLNLRRYQGRRNYNFSIFCIIRLHESQIN